LVAAPAKAVAGEDGGRLDRGVLRRVDDRHEVALDDDLRVRELLLVELSDRDEARADRLRVYDAGVQHARDPYVAHIGRRAGDDRRDRPHRDRLADHAVCAHRLGRRIPEDGHAEEAGRVARDRDRQVERLAADELAVGDRLAAAGDDAVLDRQRAHRHAELRRGHREHRLVDVGGHLADVRCTEEHEPGGDAAARRPVGVADDDLSER
jgi:hypothetical protein